MSCVSGTGRKPSAGQTGELCTILILWSQFFLKNVNVVCVVLISIPVGNVAVNVFFINVWYFLNVFL